MARDETRHSAESEVPSKESILPDVDQAIVDARTAIDEGVKEYLNQRVSAFGEAGPLASDLSDALLISVLRVIASDGKYPMEKGRFWQILYRHGPFSSSTPEDSILRAPLVTEIESLFAAAENESFEDGFDSVFSLELQRIVLRDGSRVLEIVSALVLENRVAPDVAAEALRCLGEMRSTATHEARRHLLERALASPCHVIRDGAVMALSQLSDPRSLPELEAAAAREEYRLLRANMVDLVEQLKGLQP